MVFVLQPIKMEEEVKMRSRLRGKATRLCTDLRAYRTSDNVDQDDLAYKMHVLEKVRTELKDVQIMLDKVELYDDTNHDDVMSEELFKASRLLRRLESALDNPSQPDRSFDDQHFDLRSSLVVKLPTFEGDVLKWAEFWELFKVSVHSNKRYADVQKFVLLKSLLGNVPKQVIEGIPVSEEGYRAAVDVLIRRYARDDVRRDMLLKQLLELPGVSKNDNLTAMHSLIDQLTARVRGLEALGVTSDSFSSILLPVVKEKLPEAWRLEWARVQPASADFSSFLDFLQREMEVREQAAAGPAGAASAERTRPSTSWATASGLTAHRQVGGPHPRAQPGRSVAGMGAGGCVACGGPKHGLAQCVVYGSQDVPTRWSIVRQASLCFVCLGPHLARDCRSSNCRACGERHHTSLHSEPGQHRGAGARDRLPPIQRADSRPQPSPPYCQGSVQPALQPPSPASQQLQRPGWSPAVHRQAMNVAATSAVDVPQSAEQPSAAPQSAPPQPPMPFSCTATNVHTACALPELHVNVAPSAMAHCSSDGPHCMESASPDSPNACDSVCYMQTALVEASGPRGTCQLRVLLDGGSDSSYVRTSAAELLGLPTVGRGVFACLSFQERQEEPRMYEKVRLSLRSRHGGESYAFDLWKTDRLCSQLTPTRPPAAVYSQHLLLADDFEGGPVDVLIGADMLYRVVLWEQVRLTDHLRALETVFGYILHGRDELPVTTPVKYALRCSQLPSPEAQEQLWSLEALGITVEEEETRAPMKPKWSDTEQRYEMSLLWKASDRPVSNLSSATARTRRMESRLTVPEREEYDRHLADLQRAGVVEESPVGEVDGFYLPHRGIWRNGKLRVVFDGSARDATGHSLNDYLETGGNLLRRLPAVLLNFRREPVGAQTDIRAAFHQVSVPEEDRRYLQFLWHGQRLRFRRVPFGLTCSPFMLLQTISVHLDLYSLDDSRLCAKLRAGLYMDDVCTSFCTRAEAESSMVRAEEIFHDAGMKLHKLRISGDATSEANVLGLRWNPGTDLLAVSVPEQAVVRTRREMLSVLSKPFDPLGVLSPWLVVGRSLFQRTWGAQLSASWDEELSPMIQEELAEWLREAPGRTVWFPRALLTNDCDVTYHVFCDASKRAYCCAIYSVQGGESRLVMAKSRLAPLTPALSVPRLELMATLIGARLMDSVKQALDLKNPRVIYWTDSMDVIFWLKGKKKLKLFVQNRVTTVLQLTQPDQWHHVSGEHNPADLGTRGMSITALEKCALWWRGPAFLKQDPDAGLSRAASEECDLPPPSQEATREVKQTTPVRLTMLTTRSETLPFDITSCSTLSQAVLRLAWMIRFATNSRLPKSQRTTGPLTAEEKTRSLRCCIRAAQITAFPGEIDAVRADKLLPSGSPLARLHPQLAEDGVLEAVQRTGERPVPVLPDLAHVTTLVVEDAHRRSFHQGTRVTLSMLTAEYAVRRRTVRRILEACRRCRRYRSMPYRSPEGALPSFRTQPSRPFAKVGVDFFGPLFVDQKETKVWVLLLTCATSRAVHLELVRSQATADVILALRRFCAIRGTPALVYSDNARTFRALLSQLPRSVTWRFIPEAAPWWGGFWERLVGVTKKALRITLHLCHLTFEELSATLYELAFFINLRPLTQGDGEDLLTPAHLLFGVTSIDGVLCPTLKECSISRAWRHRKRVCDHLIRRWCDEYRIALRCWSTSPRGRPVRAPRVGDVVLVYGEGPRGRWPLARVTQLLTGQDGHVRAAYINLRGRRTRRPVSRLFLLEAAG